MPDGSTRRVARINKQDLADLPARWTHRQRGRYLRGLLGRHGINPDGLFQVEYYPQRGCWLFTQGTDLSEPGASPAAGQGDEAFYVYTAAELRRTAILAVKAQASQSPHFAIFGGKYQLPPQPQVLTPGDLADLLGGPDAEPAPVRFDNEGGWQPVERRRP